jgi:hypothetical protein
MVGACLRQRPKPLSPFGAYHIQLEHFIFSLRCFQLSLMVLYSSGCPVLGVDSSRASSSASAGVRPIVLPHVGLHSQIPATPSSLTLSRYDPSGISSVDSPHLRQTKSLSLVTSPPPQRSQCICLQLHGCTPGSLCHQAYRLRTVSHARQQYQSGCSAGTTSPESGPAR